MFMGAVDYSYFLHVNDIWVFSSIDLLALPHSFNNSMLMLNEDYGAKLEIQYLLYTELKFVVNNLNKK